MVSIGSHIYEAEVEQGLTCHQTHRAYRGMGMDFYGSNDPTNSETLQIWPLNAICGFRFVNMYRTCSSS